MTESYIRSAVISEAKYYARFEEPYCIRWRGKAICAKDTNLLVEKLITIEKEQGE